MAINIAMLQPLTPELERVVRENLAPDMNLTITESTGEADLDKALEQADYAVAFGMSVPDDVIRKAPRLKMLHRWGVGLDGVPLETCREKGIAVAKTTGSNARPVAEFAVAGMLASARHLNIAHESVQKAQWLKKELWAQNLMLAGLTIGLVGLGDIGRQVALRLKGFEANVLYNKRNPLSADKEKELGVTYASLDVIIETADVISLHCPLTDETRNMLTYAQFKRMKPSAILVNTARGGVVNEGDLARALKEKVIRSAFVDVFTVEPIKPDNPLLHIENCIVAPHIGANVTNNSANGIRHWVRNILAHSKGEALPAEDLVLKG